MMDTQGRRISRLIVAAGAALAFTVAPTVLTSQTPAEPQAQPCYSGVIPGNPYVKNCSLPGPQNKIRGSAPDANAIIACRHWPGCLSWYINGP